MAPAPRTAPEAVCWLGGVSVYTSASDSRLCIASADELDGFYPRWPHPYRLLVTRNEPAQLSISLFDALGSTIQVNLLSLAGFNRPNEVLLGGSSRLNPDDVRYAPKPSEFTKQWLDEGVAPWLAERGCSALFVRAHFEGADAFFGSIQFRRDVSLGPPYFVRELNGALRPRLTQTAALDEKYNLNAQALAELRRRQDAHVEAELAYLQASLASTDDALAAHAKIKEKFKGVSLAEFEMQWAFATQFAQRFHREVKKR